MKIITLIALAALVPSTEAQTSTSTWKVQQNQTGWVVGNGTSSFPLNGKRMFTLQDGTLVPDGSLYVALAGNPTTGEWFSLTEKGWTAITDQKAVWPPTAVAYKRDNPSTGLIDLKRGATTPKLASGTQLYLGVFSVSDLSKARAGQVGIFSAPSWKTTTSGSIVVMDFSNPGVVALKGSVDGGSLRVANPTTTPASKTPSLDILFSGAPAGPNGTRSFTVQSRNLPAFTGYELQYSFDLRTWFSYQSYTGYNPSSSWALSGNAPKMFFRMRR